MNSLINFTDLPLRIHRYLPSTTVEGPGIRACVWVQGCPIHCPGCAVPWTWSDNDGTLTTVAKLAETILNGPDVEGITFLGGEPFAQAPAVAALATMLKAHGLSVMTFTGYLLEDLQNKPQAGYLELIAQTDLLIDGPFVQAQKDLSRPWCGSKNQRYHFLSPRYKHLAKELSTIPNQLEIRVSPTGKIEINGMAYPDTLESLLGSPLPV